LTGKLISPDVFVSLPLASVHHPAIPLHCELSGQDWQPTRAGGSDDGSNARANYTAGHTVHPASSLRTQINANRSAIRNHRENIWSRQTLINMTTEIEGQPAPEYMTSDLAARRPSRRGIMTAVLHDDVATNPRPHRPAVGGGDPLVDAATRLLS